MTAAAPPPLSGVALSERYPASALSVFRADERRHFLDEGGAPRDGVGVAWELLYRLEPNLYERLVAGERLHDGVLAWLPSQCGRVLELGAGIGRLTVELAPRCRSLTASEPAGPLRRRLRERLRDAGHDAVAVTGGYFDSPPAAESSVDMVISCSAFSPHRLADPELCLRAMESRCLPGGRVVMVWPDDVGWLRSRGYAHEVFAGPMTVEYASPVEAVELARIFYPHAAGVIESAGSRWVDYQTLGINAPRDVCWKTCGSP